MSLFRKIPVVVEAVQWFKHGDDPGVKTYEAQHVSEEDVCLYCGDKLKAHGWISTLEGGHIVCSGDWIITGTAGERYPCKDKIFKQIYEPVY